MAMKIRLARGGSKKRPFYAIVASDSRMPRDGRFIEKLGTYNPLLAKDSEEAIVRGTLKLGPNTSARQMLSAFNVLLDALKANPKLQVEVLQRPFDIESGKSLKGDDITVEDNKPRAFSLQVIRKLGS